MACERAATEADSSINRDAGAGTGAADDAPLACLAATCGIANHAVAALTNLTAEVLFYDRRYESVWQSPLYLVVGCFVAVRGVALYEVELTCKR